MNDIASPEVSITNEVHQFNLLRMLVYDEKHFREVYATLRVDDFMALYRDIAAEAYKFIEKYRRPPKDDIADLCERLMETQKSSAERSHKAKEIIGILVAIREETDDRFDPTYSVDQMHEFVYRQTVFFGMMDAWNLLKDGKTDEAVDAFTASARNRRHAFDAGIDAADPSQFLRFLQRDPEEENKVMQTGIPELDAIKAGPIIGGLHLTVAPTAFGKSWWMIHLGRHLAYRRHRVLHLSLEMDADITAERYAMNAFDIAPTRGEVKSMLVEKDEHGFAISIPQDRRLPTRSFADDDIAKALTDKMQGQRWLKNLRIKAIPSGAMTVSMLEAELDKYESEGFKPDVVLLDYADLMKLGSREGRRIALSEAYIDLRGLAARRELAMVTASQSNRLGVKAGRGSMVNVAESVDKVMHADVVLEMGASEDERRLGLAEIRVAKNRNYRGNVSVIISQQYATGKFVMSSALKNDKTESLVSQALNITEQNQNTDEGAY